MKAKRFLIFNPFGIGDLLFTTPLIRSLKLQLEQPYLAYLCSRRSLPAVKDNAFLDKVLIFEKDDWRKLAKTNWFKFAGELNRFIREVKAQKFDCVFDLSLNGQYGAFFIACGIKQRIGYNFKGRGRFLTHKLDIPDAYAKQHVADYYLDLLKFVGVTGQRAQFDLFVRPDDQTVAGAILANQGLKPGNKIIAVCPGAGDSWGETAYFKRWPKENFVELIKLIKQELNYNVVLFGSAAEQKVCADIASALDSKVVNLCAKISLEEFFAIMQRIELLVANDGGPFHVAQAFGKKAVVFFGPVDDKVYGAYPSLKNKVILKKEVNCRPCYQRFRFPECAQDKSCLRVISVNEAMSAVKQLLLPKS